VFRSPLADVVIPELSVYDFLFASLDEADLERVAIIDGGSGDQTSYRQLRDQVDAVAGALAAKGVRAGDVIALHSPNVPAFAVVFHGILRAGATATTVNAMYTAEEIATQLRDSGATILFTVSALLGPASEAAELVGLTDENVIVLDGAPGHPSLRVLLASGAPAPDVSFDPATHLAVLPYSSGTTGTPKGVMLTHRNLVANVTQSQPNVGVVPEDRVLAVLPFFHIYGMTVLLNLALAQRASLVTMPRFDLAEFLRCIADYRCTYAFIAPPIAVALAKHPLIDQYDLSSLQTVFSGAAPLDAALGDAVAKRIGCRMRQGYGMTEMSPVSHAIPMSWEDVSLDTVGPAVPNLESKIVDPETGEEIEIPEEGESAPGELLCRGPNIMVGYLGNPEATAAVLEPDGFLHTGDVATANARGIVTIIDRLKELIKYKGYQVAPAVLEAVLLTHPEIADAAVIGVKDEEGQEVPKAFVVPVAGSALTGQQVMDFVADHVAPHEKVRRVAFVETIPKSSAGKILRKDLRATDG
jgi:acyl-CoA synthetase (AMP-forming)/AMP-acid ligase II